MGSLHIHICGSPVQTLLDDEAKDDAVSDLRTMPILGTSAHDIHETYNQHDINVFFRTRGWSGPTRISTTGQYTSPLNKRRLKTQLMRNRSKTRSKPTRGSRSRPFPVEKLLLSIFDKPGRKRKGEVNVQHRKHKWKPTALEYTDTTQT